MARFEMAIFDVKLVTFLDILKWRPDNLYSDKILHCGFWPEGVKFVCLRQFSNISEYEGWNFNSGNYLFTTDTKQIHVSKFYCPSM